MVNSFKVVREILVTHGESVSDRPALPLQQDVVHGLGEQVSHTQAKICSQVCDSHIEKQNPFVFIQSFK